MSDPIAQGERFVQPDDLVKITPPPPELPEEGEPER